MKTLTKFFLGLLICISLIAGFSSNTVKANSSVVTIQEVNSNLFVVTLLIDGNIITISVDSGRLTQIDLY